MNYIESSLKNSNITAALEFLQKLLTKYKSNNSFLQMILERLYSLGQSLIKEKTYKPVFPLFQILCKMCTILGDYSKLCDIKNNLSFCYRNSGQTNLALKECLEALEVAGDTPSLHSKLPALHLNACAIYREDVKDLTIAKTHAELAYFFAKENCGGGNAKEKEKEKEKRTLAIACYNYALVLEELKDRANAVLWYKEGLKFCEEKWNDLYMEQVFREKVNSLSTTDQLKKTILFRKRTASQKGSTSSSRYNFVREIEKINTRPGSFRKKPRKEVKKYSLTPISNKTLPINSTHLDRSNGFYDEPEYRVKIRNANTPITSIRNPKIVSETYKTPQKNKLSLVQSVIKLQKWYRKLKNISVVKLKCDYVALGSKIFFGVRYFISVFKEQNKTRMQDPSNFYVEAWPLVCHIKKPPSLQVDLGSLCQLLRISCDESLLREKENIVLHCIQIVQSKIVLKEIELLYSGDKIISAEMYHVFIYLHDRVLEIEADDHNKKLENSIQLDPLQDLTHIVSKIPLILDKLEIKGGRLLLNLIQ